jgi:flagellar FliJ protein
MEDPMTTLPPDPLNTLLEQASAQRDEAMAALRRQEDWARRQRLQLDQLTVYRRDYHARWTGQFTQGGAVEIVHCYRNFMSRLDEAVDQQQRHADAAATARQRAHDELLAHEMRVASVRKLIERRQAERRRAAMRQEQRSTDEAALQASWRQRQATALEHHP